MAFDCYCAICGVGFSGMRIGSPSDTTLDRRKKCVGSMSRSLNGETNADSTSPEEEEDPIRSYDPRLVSTESLAWTSQVHCLGTQTDFHGKSKAFISGPGYYADAGELAVKIGQPAERTYFNCYGFGTDEAPGPVIPFHWCCFEILLRALAGTTDPKNVDLDVLYDVMMGLCNRSGSALCLPYGDEILRAQGQYWQCFPGAEYSVRHPTEIPDLEDFLRTQIQTNKRFRLPSTELALGQRQPKNSFGTLPAEIIYQICSFLPGSSLNALIQASLFMHLITQDDFFWKRFIESDMPWLWEMQMLRNPTGISPDLNYKLVYLWLDRITAPKYGMEDPALMGIANRRRIWRVCEEVSSRYSGSLELTS